MAAQGTWDTTHRLLPDHLPALVLSSSLSSGHALLPTVLGMPQALDLLGLHLSGFDIGDTSLTSVPLTLHLNQISSVMRQELRTKRKVKIYSSSPLILDLVFIPKQKLNAKSGLSL